MLNIVLIFHKGLVAAYCRNGKPVYFFFIVDTPIHHTFVTLHTALLWPFAELSHWYPYSPFVLSSRYNLFEDHALRWRHNGSDSVSNHQPHGCLLTRLFRRRSKKTSKPRVTGLCAGNSPGTGEFPAQMASNAEHVSILWRHHGVNKSHLSLPILKTGMYNLISISIPL